MTCVHQDRTDGARTDVVLVVLVFHSVLTGRESHWESLPGSQEH